MIAKCFDYVVDFLPARRYVSAALAMALSLVPMSVSVSVCLSNADPQYVCKPKIEFSKMESGGLLSTIYM